MLWTTAVLSASNISSSLCVFRAVDREIVETYPIGHGSQCGSMPNRETAVEVSHEIFFFEAFAFAERHACVEIPDIPAIGDRHVAGIRPSIDEDDSIFAKQTIIVGIIDEARHEKFQLRSFCEISDYCGAIIELGEPDAGMRTTRPDDDRKLQLGRNVRKQEIRLSHIRQLSPAHRCGCRDIKP